MSLAIFARYRFGAMPIEHRSVSPTSSLIACLISSAIARARGGSCSRPISWHTISSIDGVCATGQHRSTAAAILWLYSAYVLCEPCTSTMSGHTVFMLAHRVPS